MLPEQVSRELEEMIENAEDLRASIFHHYLQPDEILANVYSVRRLDRKIRLLRSLPIVEKYGRKSEIYFTTSV